MKEKDKPNYGAGVGIIPGYRNEDEPDLFDVREKEPREIQISAQIQPP